MRLASTSPILLSRDVAATVSFGAEDELVWKLAASGFRDTSRVAASDVTMMLDILLTNRLALGEALRRAGAHLTSLANLLDVGDEDGLRALLLAAHDQRAPMFQSNERGQ